MEFVWLDYEIFDKDSIEAWLDRDARKTTGIDGSFEELYRYWLRESEGGSGNELWCKVVFQYGIPVAAVLVGCHEDEFTVSELIVEPSRRGKGIGTAVLTELIKYGADILGKDINSAMAVIFPYNYASRRIFEKSGFNYDSTHPDGDALYYVYRKETKKC